MAKIIIKITEDGKLITTVEGVKGEGCVDIDSFLTSLGETKSFTETEEYYENEIETVNVEIG